MLCLEWISERGIFQNIFKNNIKYKNRKRYFWRKYKRKKKYAQVTTDTALEGVRKNILYVITMYPFRCSSWMWKKRGDRRG